MLIEVLDAKIEINLIYDIKGIEKYFTSGKEEYIINSHILEKIKEYNNPYYKNEHFLLYREDEKIIQVQKEEDKTLGYIVYDNKLVDIYLYENTKRVEYILSQYAINYIITKYLGGIIFHASSIIYNDLGIAFSAKSGTGKSTLRARLESVGAYVINDDKTILYLSGDEIYLASSPWSGKHRVSSNLKHKLDIICFLYQNDINRFDEIDFNEALKLLMGQIDLAYDYNKEIWNNIVSKALSKKIIRYGLTNDNNALEAFVKEMEKYAK